MKTINEMFAFVAVNEEGEGLIGQKFSNTFYPFVGADMDRVESLRPLAEEISKMTGKKIKILKFSAREEIGEIESK